MQLVQALENDDVPAVRAMLDAHPALVSTPIPEEFTKEQEYPIHRASSREMIELLVCHGADVNAVGSWEQSPLHNTHDLDIVRLLVSLGAKVDGTTSNRCTPLLCQVESPEIVEFLIRQGANVNAISEWGTTALHEVAEYDEDRWRAIYSAESREDINRYLQKSKSSRLQSARLLLENGATIDKPDHWGRTALHIAAIEGFTEMLGLLISAGADVNARDAHGETPLHSAARRGQRKSVEILLKRGSDADSRSKAGWYPLEVAMMHGSSEVLDLLQRKTAPKDAARLFDAIYKGDIVRVNELITRRPALVKVKNGWSTSALSVAVGNGFEEGVDLLLEAGADPNTKDNLGDRPLTVAVTNGSLTIAKRLLDAGAKVDTSYFSRRQGWTPRSEAVKQGDVATAELLIKYGGTASDFWLRRLRKLETQKLT